MTASLLDLTVGALVCVVLLPVFFETEDYTGYPLGCRQFLVCEYTSFMVI